MFTVQYRNHALRSGRWRGTFDTRELAEEYAKKEASRSQPFVEYNVHQGTPKSPGAAVGPTFHGAPPVPCAVCRGYGALTAKDAWTILGQPVMVAIKCATCHGRHQVCNLRRHRLCFAGREVEGFRMYSASETPSRRVHPPCPRSWADTGTFTSQ